VHKNVRLLTMIPACSTVCRGVQGVPLIAANFDENLSKSVHANYVAREGLTDLYPWSSYFADRKTDSPQRSFAISHTQGMMS